MTLENFVLIELCIVAIIFIFDCMRWLRKNKSEKLREGIFDGRIVVNTTDPEKDVFRLEYNGNLAEIQDKQSVIFEIVRED